MKKDSLISIIVPVYKVEKYLNKCIHSIVNQTYQNLEIILVDDGSPDNCPQICDEWQKKDSRIQVIHKENGGLSSARNAGMEVANGDYIGFVDSDDYIEHNMYEKLYATIMTEGADMVICNYDMVTEDKKLIVRQSPIKNDIFNGKDGLGKLVQAGSWYYVTVWNKLYSRHLIEELRFPVGKIHEDEFFVHHVFEKCNKVATISESLYKYVQRPGSIMSAQNLVKSLDAVEAFCDRINFYKDRGLNEYIEPLLSVLKMTYIRKRMFLTGQSNLKNRERIREIDKLFYKTYFSNKKNASIKEKILLRYPTILLVFLKMKRKSCKTDY